ncbi:glycosyltransferase family A protein [Streptomyces sp. NPDC048242]|uniref:glycosyltransferase family A protein n=1 Tax=Streptomyces sp. NPDC048242 TaxID=3155026 RepID=UPI00343BBEF9
MDPMPPAPQDPHPAPRVAVVVIGYDDAAHVADAVRSALRQGPAVGEVIAVDDCSTDGSAELLERLAVHDPRLRVVRRSANSGGCGTPRNTGIDAVTLPYVMFLDSDDILPAGAVDALLRAAVDADAEVAAGLCVRRELPSGREHPWHPALYAAPAVLAGPDERPRLVEDTLCVNKLYRTAFLREHGIRFPEGRFLYEDYVFTARVLAAAPRVALVPDRVYTWNVRRSADRLSLSLDRDGIDNWRSRTRACAQADEILLRAGRETLARAARAKFLDYELRMYVRDLGLRNAEYRRAWWEHTREFLGRYDDADWESDPAAPGPLTGRVIMACPEPAELPRLRELAARPARLLPPYARAADGTPVWSDGLPQVSLAPLLTRPASALPVMVDAELLVRMRGSRLRLRLHELYGRVADAGPLAVTAEWRFRATGRTARRATVPFAPTAPGLWTAEAPVDLTGLGSGVWDLCLTLHFKDGTSREATAHARGGSARLRRRVLPDPHHLLLLAHPYATHSGALALRVATGPGGAARVAKGRLRRLLR